MTLNEVSKFDDLFEFGKTLTGGSGSFMGRASLVSLGLVFLISDLEGTERLGAQLVSQHCDGFGWRGSHEVVHNLGCNVPLGLMVEFGDGCDEGCGVCMVYGFLNTRMCTRGAHEVCDCRSVGGGVGFDEVECWNIGCCMNDGLVSELGLDWIGWWVSYFTFGYDVSICEKEVRNIIIMFDGYDDDWLKDVVHTADHVVLPELDLYIVAEMHTQGVHCDELRSDEDDVGVFTAADWTFLDGGALEAPESHLRAVRTPANFWG